MEAGKEKSERLVIDKVINRYRQDHHGGLGGGGFPL